MSKKFTFNTLWVILKETFSKWWAKDPFRESATIAYYAIFSIPALLAIIVAIAALFFGQEAVSGQISDQVSAAMSPEAAKQIEDIIAKASETKQSIIATIIGVITLILGATGVLVQFQKSLNNIWEVKVDPNKKAWLHTVQSRLFSLGIVATFGFLLLISMVVTIALSALSNWMTQRFPDVVSYLLEGVNFMISIAVIAVMFAMMFKILPDAKIRWKHVALGGLLTSVLFVLGKFAIGFYFGKSDPASAYGAAGSVILILLWVSYSSMIVFLGAEFTKAFVMHTGGKVIPKKNAVYVPGLEEQVTRANSNEKDPSGSSTEQQSKRTIDQTKRDNENFASIKNSTSSRKWLRIAFLLWPLMSIAFNVIPFLRRFVINKVLGKIKNADANVHRMRLSLITHSCTIKGFEYNKIGFGEDETLDCSAEMVKLTFNWKALWRGVLICEAIADGIAFHITKHKKNEDTGGNSTFLMEGLQTDVPIILKQLEIKNSTVSFTDISLNPDVHIEAKDIRIAVTNLSTIPLNQDALPTAVSLRANIYEGFLTVRLKANLLEKSPALDMDAEMIGLNMVEMNDFFKAYGKFDVNKGTLGFFAEAAAEGGKYKGYVKPVIRNLDVLGPEDRHENMFSKIWESAIAATTTVFKNPHNDQLATKVPFQGVFKPEVNVWYAIGETLVNAFVHALKPSIDYEINLNSVEENSK